MTYPRELELVEKYEVGGQRRFRLRIKGTNIILNVEAEDEEEALRKAAELMVKLKMV